MLTKFGKKRLLNLAPHSVFPDFKVVGDETKHILTTCLVALINTGDEPDINQLTIGPCNNVGLVYAPTMNDSPEDSADYIYDRQTNGLGIRRLLPLITATHADASPRDNELLLSSQGPFTDLVILTADCMASYTGTTDQQLIDYIRQSVTSEKVVSRTKFKSATGVPTALTIPTGATYGLTPFIDVDLNVSAYGGLSHSGPNPLAEIIKQDTSFAWIKYKVRAYGLDYFYENVPSPQTVFNGGDFSGDMMLVAPLGKDGDFSSRGFYWYEFPIQGVITLKLRVDGPVLSNQPWFVVAMGYYYLRIDVIVDVATSLTEPPLLNWNTVTIDLSGVV